MRGGSWENQCSNELLVNSYTLFRRISINYFGIFGKEIQTMGSEIQTDQINVIETQLSSIPFAIVGDSHLVSLGYNPMNKEYVLDESGKRYKRILQRIASSNASFMIHGGDTVGKTPTGRSPDEKYKAFANVTKGIFKRRVFYILGNWDRVSLFTKYISPTIRGVSNVPGSNGKVKMVVLDNADGSFHAEDLVILRGLSSKYQYLIDFHRPLRVGNLGNMDGHIISKAQTDLFFSNIPKNVRNRILAIFTHHRHTFFYQKNNIFSGFSRTSFFITPCSGRYRCLTPGYLRASLIRGTNDAYHLMFNPKTDFVKVT